MPSYQAVIDLLLSLIRAGCIDYSQNELFLCLRLAGYTYAANDGLLTQMTYSNGNTAAYDYDDLERVKNIYYNNSSSPAYTYTYKEEGTLGQLTDNTNNRTYAYTYDSQNQLLTEVRTRGRPAPDEDSWNREQRR